MESNVKFSLYSSYIFELLFKNKLFIYISRTNILQNYILHFKNKHITYYKLHITKHWNLKYILRASVYSSSTKQSSHTYLVDFWWTLHKDWLHMWHFDFSLLFSFTRFFCSQQRPLFVLWFSICGRWFTSWIFKTRLILLRILIWRPFGFSNRHWRLGRTRAFSSSYVNSGFVTLTLLSLKIVLALVLHVSNTNANTFKGHLFDLTLVEWSVDKRSTISTSPWSYITGTCGFVRWSLVTLTLSA